MTIYYKNRYKEFYIKKTNMQLDTFKIANDFPNKVVTWIHPEYKYVDEVLSDYIDNYVIISEEEYNKALSILLNVPKIFTREDIRGMSPVEFMENEEALRSQGWLQ